MATSFVQVVICLLAGIVLIVLLTAAFKVPAFFALLLACFVVGLGLQMPVATILDTAREGFGNIMRSLGFILVLGTALGVILEHTGSTQVMAAAILKVTGEKNAAWCMSITGFVAGLPIFCDSGFIVLSGLNNSLARRTGTSIVVTGISLATGLYAVHCLVPPHPGVASAAVTLGVDFGKLILLGISVAIPAMVVGHLWARHAAKKITAPVMEEGIEKKRLEKQPSVFKSFLPVLVPILLIAIKSFVMMGKDTTGNIIQFFTATGDPVIALSIGLVLALNCMRHFTKRAAALLLQEAVEKAGSILVIIGAGGAFGAVLAATKVGEHFSHVVALGSLGIFFPFLLTFILKTAQGSSTVAIITAASIVQPLLPALHLAGDRGQLLCILSMGAGSMMISHANDAYFWVIAKFCGLDMRTMLRVYSMATILMGITTLLMVYLLSVIW
jgi:gluconate:H+ symporter, GntP family